MNTSKNILFKIVLSFAAGFLVTLAVHCKGENKPGDDVSKSVFDQNKKCFGQGAKTANFTTLDWQPYIGADLTNFGPNHEIVVEAMKRMGYRVCTAFFTWERTNKMGIEGQQVDGYFPEYFNKDYEKELLYSAGYPAGPAGFMKRKDKEVKVKTQLHMKDFHALKPYRIGVVRGYVNTGALDQAIGQFLDDVKDPAERKKQQADAYLYQNRDPADSDEQNLEKLYHNRVQLVFIDPNVAQFHIKRSLEKKYSDINEKLTFIEPPLINHQVYTCFSRKAINYQQKQKDFNEGLKIITQDGTLRKIMEKHGFKTRDGKHYSYGG